MFLRGRMKRMISTMVDTFDSHGLVMDKKTIRDWALHIAMGEFKPKLKQGLSEIELAKESCLQAIEWQREAIQKNLNDPSTLMGQLSEAMREGDAKAAAVGDNTLTEK